MGVKIVCIADMHSKLNFKVPECDLLLIAGDMEPAYYSDTMSVGLQSTWLNMEFRYWLGDQPVKECVAIAGNHSWIWQVAKNRVPKLNANFHYIEDETIEMFGLKIHGTPVTCIFNDWAFNRSEEVLQRHWDNIPDDTDILLCHSPIFGIMDKVERYNLQKHIGSKSLKRRIREIKPKMVIFGHAHGEYGVVDKFGIKFINCSLVNEDYDLVREPIIVEV